MKVNEILKGKLYQRGKFVHLGYDDKIATIQDYGIDVVVSMAGPMDPDMGFDLYMYIYNPVADGKVIHSSILWMSEMLADLIDEGHCVMSNCNAGRNRSGLLNCLIVRRLLHTTGAEALEIVRAGRPRSLGSNPFFENWMLSLSYPTHNIGGI